MKSPFDYSNGSSVSARKPAAASPAKSFLASLSHRAYRLATGALTLVAACTATIPQGQAGSIARLVYDGVTGATVATLTNAAIFPNSPTFREQLDDFTPSPTGGSLFGFQSKDNVGSNFGSYIRGYLQAPATGDYVFFISSDDASEFWLSTDLTPANRRLIAFESTGGTPLFSGPRLNERRSVAISLVRGQTYYLEVLHKQSAGSSFIRAGWQRPDGVQEIIPTRHLYQHPLDPFLGQGDASLPPTFNFTGLNAGDLPTAAAVNEGEDLILELDVVAAHPVTIQWRVNGVVVSGENLSYLKLGRVSAALNGQTVQAIVSNGFGQLTSATAQLSITPDTAAPTVATVDHRGNPNQLTVFFSEPVSLSTATNLANYEIKPAGGAALTIQSVKLLADDKTVQLGGNFNFQLNGQYQWTVRNINDRALTPNSLSPNPTQGNFTFAGEFIGPISFASPLQNLQVVENRSAHLEAFLAGAKPWYYQWSRNGAVVTGATNSSLDVPPANVVNGDTYSVAVSNDFSSAVSATVQLTVVPDIAAPRLLSVRGLAGVNTVRLGFDEVLSPATATNVANYSVDSITVLSASLSSDGKTVTLQTSPLQAGQIYTLALIGIRDIAVAGNVLNANASFIGEVDYAGEVLADGPVRYWRFNEESGTAVATVATGVDTLATGTGTLANGVALGQASLVPSAPEDKAVKFVAADNQRITVPNGSDLNATLGPWPKKTVEFWFKANSAPAPETTGLAATAGIWEQGAATRSIAAYLWRDPANANPDEAALVFHAFNNASDGPGAPFGLTTLPAVFVQHTVQVGQAYHVVAVFDGDATGTTGNLILYVNGVEVGRAPGAGQIYNHTGDVQIGRGNALTHTGGSGDFGFFDGVLDDLSTYNKALTAARVTAHHQAGIGGGGGNSTPLTIASATPRGNSNQLLVTFTKPVAETAAEVLARYALKTQGGTAIPVTAVELLAGGLTAQLTGSFNFQAGNQYTISVSDVTSAAATPQVIAPNPSSASFTFTNGAVGIGAGSEIGNRTVIENQEVRFVVLPSGSGPFTYQWFYNNGALPGKNQAELRVTATSATVGDYYVRVNNAFSQVNSSVARLGFDIDNIPPRLLAIRGVAGSINQVRLTLDEAVDVTSATALSTYQINGLTVNSATVSASGLEVVLNTSQQQSGQVYTLQINGLKDRAAAGNALTTTAVFASEARYADEILADSPIRYWRFEETSGLTLATDVTVLDPIATSGGTLVNSATLGVPGLLTNLVDSKAVQIHRLSNDRVSVPNGSDINAVAGPWAKKTIQFWFRADSVPAPGTTGLAATAGLWEQGAASRSIAVYLWRDPANANTNEATLVFNAVNNVADGLGAPYGPPAGPAVYVQTPVRTGQTYHVVAVFDGDATGLNGNLILYVNGVEAGRAPGVGQIFNHTGDVQIGRGNGLTHENINGDFGSFEGVIDEVSLYNTALSSQRVAQLYTVANTQPPGFARIDTAASDLGDRTALVGQSVHFAVVATGTGPFSYQWYRNGGVLTNQSDSSLDFTASLANAGDYTVTVSNAFSSVTSAPARLTVQADSFPPELAHAEALGGSIHAVRLTFTRPVESVSATNTATYQVAGAAPLEALLSANGLTVTLHTPAQTPGQSIIVTIQGLRDQATPDGILNTQVTIESRLSYADEILADGPVRYWHFNETEGTNAVSVVSVLDAVAPRRASLFNSPTLGVPGLVPNQGDDTAIRLTASQTNRILVPNGADINITAGPWAKKTFSLWFRADSLPRGGATPQAPVLWEQGGDSRGLGLYLYGTQDVANPSEALLVWNVYNNAADGVTGGWGVALTNITNAVFVTAPVQTNTTYHVVAVYDGDTAGTNGVIRLYVNGELAGTVGGAGQLFNHTADVQIGRGAFVRHDGLTAGNRDYFDGVLDEFAVYNKALTTERVSQLYQIGQAGGDTEPPAASITDVRVQDGNIIITWEGEGQLEAADSVTGPYTPVNNNQNPYSEPVSGANQRFFRLVP